MVERPASTAEADGSSHLAEVTITLSSSYTVWTVSRAPVSTGLPSGPTSTALAPESRVNSSSSAPQSSGALSASRSARAAAWAARSSLATAV